MYVFASAHVENMQIFQHTNEWNMVCWTDKDSILEPLWIETQLSPHKELVKLHARIYLPSKVGILC